MTQDAKLLPPGDISFDGEHLSVDGIVLAPGRHRSADGDYVIEVVDAGPDDLGLVDELDED